METLPFRTASPGELDQLGAAGLADKLSEPPHLALPWLGGAAMQGNLDAQMILGQWFLAGHGLPRDEAQAFAWFKHAAHAGHAGAANMAGRCYENGWGTLQDDNAAAHWYTLAAQRGSDWGMYNLATALVLGRGIGASRAEALDWYRRAAGMGHAKSLNIVGGFYEDGWEVGRDAATAMDYYRRAAEGGDFRGQFNYARTLALCGREREAIRWVRQVPRTANAPFIEKMLAFLRDAPDAVLNRLFTHADAAARLSSRENRSSA
ncbi:tetratricopeptide repeat protein [Cupriavidus basilensis]|uniref:Tetratricopeptide repeat protein n=1 Tax=Cupriavidus basilensis TaxID=68895 RepID=A0ABT6B0L8_9BURK|nr:tetratricopeptide repeat protein [Cupriavidus basilensis]MDF3838153.1 tetratricopeptide repeat protein [Cupriavidus basilensis]